MRVIDGLFSGVVRAQPLGLDQPCPVYLVLLAARPDDESLVRSRQKSGQMFFRWPGSCFDFLLKVFNPEMMFVSARMIYFRSLSYSFG